MLVFVFLVLMIPLFSSLRMGFISKRSMTMVSERSNNYLVTLLPGDGIGPEIVRATVPVLEAVAKKNDFIISFQEGDIGGIAIDKHNDPFPDSTFEMCMAGDSVLLGAIGGYKWDNNPRELRPESGLLKMRKSMDLFANLRPAKVIPQLMAASTLKPEVLEGIHKRIRKNHYSNILLNRIISLDYAL